METIKKKIIPSISFCECNGDTGCNTNKVGDCECGFHTMDNDECQCIFYRDEDGNVIYDDTKEPPKFSFCECNGDTGCNTDKVGDCECGFHTMDNDECQCIFYRDEDGNVIYDDTKTFG